MHFGTVVAKLTLLARERYC